MRSRLGDKARLKLNSYDPAFVKRILEAEKSARKGNVTRIKDTSNIWADILSPSS